MMLLSKLVLAVLLCSFTVAVTGVAVDQIRTQYMKSIQTLMSARSSSERHVEVGDEACYLWYFDAVDFDIGTFYRNSDNCNNTEYNAIKLFNENGAGTRADFVHRKNLICNDFNFCENWYDDLLSFYDCYRGASAKSMPEIYNLSTNSTAEYSALFKEYNRVYSERNNCDEDARLVFIADSDLTNLQFEQCRDGKGVPPSRTTGTTTSFTPTPTSTTYSPTYTPFP